MRSLFFDLVSPESMTLVMPIGEFSVSLHRTFVIPLTMKNNPLINFKKGRP